MPQGGYSPAYGSAVAAPGPAMCPSGWVAEGLAQSSSAARARAANAGNRARLALAATEPLGWVTMMKRRGSSSTRGTAWAPPSDSTPQRFR